MKLIGKERKMLWGKIHDEGLDVRVPDCHFLIIDKPQGMMCSNLSEDIEKKLKVALRPALMNRYYNAAYDWMVGYAKKPGRSWLKGKKLALQNMKNLKKIKSMQLEGLDAYASGVVAFALEDATALVKKFQDFEGGTREYECVALFGKGTNTHYQTGRVVEESDYRQIRKEAIDDIIKEQFTGNIMQVPPIFSEVKLFGKPMWRYARTGKTASDMKVEPRPVTVMSFKIIKFEPPYASFHVECCRHTFIRSLIHDLGHALGSCASVAGLRRTRIGPFKVEDAISGSKQALKKLRTDIHNHARHANSLIPGVVSPQPRKPKPFVPVFSEEPENSEVDPEVQYARQYMHARQKLHQTDQASDTEELGGSISEAEQDEEQKDEEEKDEGEKDEEEIGSRNDVDKTPRASRRRSTSSSDVGEAEDILDDDSDRSADVDSDLTDDEDSDDHHASDDVHYDNDQRTDSDDEDGPEPEYKPPKSQPKHQPDTTVWW
ncbi:putative tRNA pseudouridine synthase 1 [Porphyridium purpureum]|uniref:tRNA pseudouridine(55) synthase n=1 Tax=Porphyridium purpureum TaxID=35688 RepID=A0A5J4YMN5_PORPP|nr:putative tRNA pseudouridine synthase 1 [Porphyridium purpureum]|eukprot:POR7455..scf244_11